MKTVIQLTIHERKSKRDKVTQTFIGNVKKSFICISSQPMSDAFHRHLLNKETGHTKQTSQWQSVLCVTFFCGLDHVDILSRKDELGNKKAEQELERLSELNMWNLLPSNNGKQRESSLLRMLLL